MHQMQFIAVLKPQNIVQIVNATARSTTSQPSGFRDIDLKSAKKAFKALPRIPISKSAAMPAITKLTMP